MCTVAIESARVIQDRVGPVFNSAAARGRGSSRFPFLPERAPYSAQRTGPFDFAQGSLDPVPENPNLLPMRTPDN